VRKVVFLVSTAIAFLIGGIVSSTNINNLQAGAISASEVQQLKARLDRVDRDLASAKRELTELRRRYSQHTHRLNVDIAAAPEVPSMIIQGPDVRLLFYAGAGNPLITSRPR
jgi:hypothetical protein